MEYEIKKADYNNEDFKKLCIKLDEFKNVIIPERRKLGLSALDGLYRIKYVLMIYYGNKAVACAGLKPIDITTAEVARVYTDDNYRGKGLAKILVERIIEYAKSKGYIKLVLDTWKDSTSARNLYKKLGFIEIDSFDMETLKKSFSTDDEELLRSIHEKLVFMEKNINNNDTKSFPKASINWDSTNYLNTSRKH